MENKSLQNRMKRIEGQVRGIENMIQENKYCVDIITQINAVTAALNKVSLEILENHIQTCVTDAIQNDIGEEKIKEVMMLIQKMQKL